MEVPVSVEFLGLELARRGLPNRYVKRVIAELSDHQADALADEQRAGFDTEAAGAEAARRLGPPDQLVAAIVREYRAGTFVGRHPWLSLVLAPIPMTILTFAGFILAGASGLFLLPDAFGADPIDPNSSFVVWLLLTYFYASMVVPPALAGWLVCRSCERAGRDGRWMLAGCLLVGLVAGAFHTSLQLPVEPGQGRYSVGFMFVGYPVPPLLPQLAQAIVPMTVYAVFLWRQRLRRFELQLEAAS